MKNPGVPVLALDSFPQRPARRAYYLERLDRHLANFPGVSTPHTHSFYLLLYVTTGHGTHTIDLVTYDLKPGSVFFMTPGQVHHWQLSSDAQGYIIFFTPDFYLFRYPGSRLFEYPFFNPQFPPVLYLTREENELRPLVEKMWREAATPAAQQEDIIRSYLHIFLELAARHYPEVAAPGSDEHPHSLQLLREFGLQLNQHFRQSRTVQDYADRLHVSPNHLNALCRRHLGKTASMLIQERVVLEAQRLLTHSTQTVAQIADALGFEDASYFGRYFRKHAARTPEQYRKAELKDQANSGH
ncbi:AraC family transcriptional regulator [Hymenobacter sp. BT730]|uniref:AraC family transcriptional regulator n=1 Tax=Hymenobacter sp. BT730 TaxID=3063332 RepID=UPI0026DF8747|nr:helix-turn-helix transcriptional regulator [Hymenobacter sp. BT730]